MTFASLEFGVLLTLVFATYYWLPQRGRMLMLLAASYVFYCYWNPMYGILILASTVLDYAMALLIGQTRVARRRRLALLASVLGNLAILFYFKYTDFALDSLRSLLGPLGSDLPGPLALVLPVGISFYTFQTMSYTIDVYRGEKEPERDFVLVALYVSFFPQLVAGPIERAQALMPQLKAKHAFALHNLEEGGRLILWGLLKKVVFADRLAHACYPAFLSPGFYRASDLAFSAVGMAICLYLDFSAYSQIARGTARLFGIRLTRNFNQPLVARNVIDYWRRWHISMSNWVRDYLFRPLGGFTPRHMVRQFRTTLITMGLVGLWHGANWTFVLWGLGHGLLIVGYEFLRLRKRRLGRRNETPGWAKRFFSWLLTRSLAILLSILFFSPDLGHAIAFFDGLFFHPLHAAGVKSYLWLGWSFIIAFWGFHYAQFRLPLKQVVDDLHPAARGALYAALTYIVLFGAVSSANQFIYFQF